MTESLIYSSQRILMNTGITGLKNLLFIHSYAVDKSCLNVRKRLSSQSCCYRAVKKKLVSIHVNQLVLQKKIKRFPYLATPAGESCCHGAPLSPICQSLFKEPAENIEIKQTCHTPLPLCSSLYELTTCPQFFL